MRAVAMILALGFSATACAGTTTTPATTPTTTTTAKATTGATPSEVCLKLVDAAKSNNFEEFMTWSTEYSPNHGPKAAKGTEKFKKMHTEYFDKIKAISCGTEHIAGNRAFVEATTGSEKRFVPFALDPNGQWKFHPKTYMTFYPMPNKGKMMKKSM